MGPGESTREETCGHPRATPVPAAEQHRYPDLGVSQMGFHTLFCCALERGMAADWEWNTAVPLGTRDASRHCTPGVPLGEPASYLPLHPLPSILSFNTHNSLSQHVR